MNRNTHPKIWLSSPHMSGNEIKYVDDAFANNWIAPLGPNINAFEKSLQDYTNSSHVGALSSGTAALHLGLLLLGVKSDDFVITQSLTFAASANPIRYLGGIPIFVDSEWSTWNMCPYQMEKAIIACIQGRIKGHKAKLPAAIVPVHLFGMPANMDEIMTIAAKYGIPVLEDAAEALGSTYRGKHCGTFGKMGVLSFNGNKIITTSGGGALMSESAELIQRARHLSTQAREDVPHFEHLEIGYNYRMSNVLAGIGCGQLEVLDQRVMARRRVFESYKNFFNNFEGISIHQESSSVYYSNHWLSAILIDPMRTGGIDREFLRLRLAERNIEARPVWKPMHQQPVYKDYPFFGSGVADEIFSKGLCLPSGSNLSMESIYDILDFLNQVLGQKTKAKLLATAC